MSQCYEEKKQIAHEKSELMKMQREIIQKTTDDRNSTMKVSILTHSFPMYPFSTP